MRNHNGYRKNSEFRCGHRLDEPIWVAKRSDWVYDFGSGNCSLYWVGGLYPKKMQNSDGVTISLICFRSSQIMITEYLLVLITVHCIGEEMWKH